MVGEAHHPEDYERGNPDLDPVAESAVYELEKRLDKMEKFELTLHKGLFTRHSLKLNFKPRIFLRQRRLWSVYHWHGHWRRFRRWKTWHLRQKGTLIKVEIYLRQKNKVFPGQAAEKVGIQMADQIVEVDGISLVGVSHSFAADTLRSTSTVIVFANYF